MRLFLSLTDTDDKDDAGWTIRLPCILSTTLVSLLLVSWICQGYFSFCPIMLVLYVLFLLFSINLICPDLYICQGQAQDSWRLHSLAYQLLILTHSDFKLLFDAGMGDRLYVANTSNWLVVTVGNWVEYSLKSGLNWKTAEQTKNNTSWPMEG